MLLSAFFFSLMGVLVKLVGQRLPSGEIVLARAAVSLILSYALLKRAGVAVWGHHRGLLLLRGLFGCLALHGVFFSLTRLPLADATVLHFLNPVLTAVLAALVLGEHIGWRLTLALILSIVGVVTVRRPEFLFGTLTDPLDPVAVWAALIAAFLSACAYVLVRRLAAVEHSLVIVFYFPLVTVPLTLPFVATDLLWPTPLEWLLLLGVGVCTQLGQVYLTIGMRHEPAGRATALSYTQVVFASLWGMLIFAELPTVWTVTGAMFILTGTYLNIRRRRESPPIHSSPSWTDDDEDRMKS